MTRTIDIRDGQPPLSDLLNLTSGGDDVVIVEGGKPLARLIPATESRQRIMGLHAGAMKTSDDFDAPLPDEFWTRYSSLKR